MDKFKSFGKKIVSGKYFFPVVMNIIVMLILTLLFYAKYQCEMDIVMQTLLYGCSFNGENISHLVFINIIAGGILSFLAKMFPGVAWYTMMHYGATLASLISLSYVMVNRCGRTKASKIIATVISIFVGYECYITPMYMKTTILLVVVAVLWLVYSMTESEKGLVSAIFSVLFGGFAALLSFKVFVMGMLMSLAAAVIYVFIFRVERKRWKMPLISLAAIVVIAGGSYLIDERAYAQGSEWEAIGDNREVLEQLYVMGFPEYDKVEGALMEQGVQDVTADDYNIWKQGFFRRDADCAAILNLIAQQRVDITRDNVLLFFHTIPIKAFKTGMFYAWLVLAVLLATSLPKKRATRRIAISLIMVGIPYFVQYLSYGCNAQWMGMIAYMPAILFLLWQLPVLEVPEEENRYVAVYLCLMGLVLYYIFSGTFNGPVQETKEIGDVVALQREEAEFVHLVDMNSYVQKYSIYTPYPKKIDSGNCYVINDIYQWIPGFRNMQEIATQNPMAYKLYTRSKDTRKCVVENVKLFVRLKGFEKEEISSFHGMHTFRMLSEEAINLGLGE